MNKKLIYLLYIALFCVFTACHKDDDNDIPTPEPPAPLPTASELLEGTYNVELLASTASAKDTSEQTLSFVLIDKNMVQLTTSSFNLGSIGNLKTITVDSIPVTEKDGSMTFNINNKSLSSGMTIKTLSGTLKDKEINFQMSITWKDADIALHFNGKQTKNNQAIIYKIIFNSDVVSGQPELVDRDFTFYVKADATASQLQLSPAYHLAKGAKVNPEAGEIMDFSQAAASGQPIKINVASEDLSKIVSYNIYCKRSVDVNTSMESWVKGVEGQEPDMTFYEVANGWSSSNTGAHFLKAFAGMGIFIDPANVNYNMVKVADPQDGQYAAKIITLNTQLNELGTGMGFDGMIPGITSGTLFLGKFVTDVENTLKSTKFGVPFFQKPTHFKGYYKYTAGTTYYVTKVTGEGDDMIKTVVVDNSQTDVPAMNAVLYEVSNYSQPKDYYQEALTGVNLFTSDKVVARAEVKNTGAQGAYTAFDVQFEYKTGKTYDPTKLYMLAIVFASSKDGDKFCGAPGSTLVVDNVKIVTE